MNRPAGTRRRWLLPYLAASLLATGLYLLLPALHFTWVESLELTALNFRLRLRGTAAHSAKVVIVAIDDRSLSELYYRDQNAWPWRRGVWADLLDRLETGGARAVGMDLSFDTLSPSDPEGDRRFAESLFLHPNVTVGTYLINNRAEWRELAPGYQRRLAENQDYLRFRYHLADPDKYFLPRFFSPYKVVPPETLFMNAAGAYGPYEIGLPEEDGMFHNLPLVVAEAYLAERGEGSLVFLPNLDLLTLAAYFGVPTDELVLDLKAHRIRLGDRRAIPIDESGYFTVNYYGKRAFAEVPVTQVLSERNPQRLARLFKDKVVLVGYTAKAKGLFDLRPTPFNRNEAGIQIHATVIQNVLDQQYLRRTPYNAVIFLALFALFACLLLLPQLSASIFWALAVIAAYNVANYLLFLRNVWVDLFYPDVVLVAFFLFNTVTRVYQENREKLQIKGFFSKYVPAPVVEEILADPERINLGGEEMKITVLFSDIVGFTTISEQLAPAEVVRLLNEYLTEMTAVLKDQYGGTLDKFIGDAIVAIFGAPFGRPDDAARAVRAALAMQAKAQELEARWRARGEKHVFRLGVGINTGRAVVGNIGSPDRLNYTCIGDTVNTAARLEAATRTTGATILISQSTQAEVEGRFRCEELPPLTVKGKQEPLTVYSVLGRIEENRVR